METEVSYTKTSLYGAIFKRKSFHLFRGVGDDRIERSELFPDAGGEEEFTKVAVYKLPK